MLNVPVEDEWSPALARYRMFRSRVISGYSRDIRYRYIYTHIPVHELLFLIWELRPDGE